MIFTGNLISCKREVKTFKDGKPTENLLWLTVANVELSDKKKAELDEAFKDTGKKQIPGWFKKFEGYVNVKTKFELPCKDPDGNEYESIEAFIKDFKWLGAPCKLSITIKKNEEGEATIYPKALIFTGEGEAYNPFSDFDDDEED